MADTKNKLTVAAALALLLLAASMADIVTGAEAAKEVDGGGEAKKEGGEAAGEVEAKKEGGEAGEGEAKKEGGGGGDVVEFCSATDYKETCEKSVEKAKSKNPKDLVKAAFDAASQEIQSAIKNSDAYKKVKTDPMTQKALVVCEEVLNNAIDDLRRSFDKVDKIESGTLKNNMGDLKNWLSATVAHKETCIDAFENTTGDTGEKVKEILNTSSELLSNGLALISELQKVFSSFDFGKLADKVTGAITGESNSDDKDGGSEKPRQLLGEDDGIPDFIDMHARRLMAAPAGGLKPDTVVAQDGSGQYKTINAALKTLPPKSNKPFVVFVKAGLYKEYVLIPKGMNNVALIGEGPLKTRITGNKCVKGGTPTFHSGTLTVTGEGFMAKDIAIENTAPESQAVAMRINGDMAVFHNVHFDGFQDTLYSHSYRQFFRDCRISGTIDFIFGDAMTVLQNCQIVVRKPLPNQACMVTAQGRKDRKSSGVIVIQGGAITAEKAFVDAKPPFEAYLGRPWKEFSRTIIMQASIDGFISPQGWSPWMGTFALDTLFYGEWQNKGPGSDLSKRVKWKGIQKMNAQIAESFTAAKIYTYDDWIKKTGVPYVGGMLPK